MYLFLAIFNYVIFCFDVEYHRDVMTWLWLATAFGFSYLFHISSKPKPMTIDDIIPTMNKISECLDNEIEKTDDENEEHWAKIRDAIDIIHGISEDNSMFI